MNRQTTIKEFAGNPDGKTYNGFKLVQWLMYTATNKLISEEESKQIVSDAIAKTKERMI